MNNVIYAIYMFIMGTIMGSFFNVVGHRLSNNKSIIKPKIAKAVKMITVSVSKPICGVVCMTLPTIKKCTKVHFKNYFTKL